MKTEILFVWLILCIFTPSLSSAVVKKHPSVPAEQECSECHTTQAQAWQSGKHGLMNVKCVVCHGSTDKTFSPKPGIYQCQGCHGEKVGDVEKKLPQKSRDCFLCHDKHSVTVRFHGSTKSPQPPFDKGGRGGI